MHCLDRCDANKPLRSSVLLCLAGGILTSEVFPIPLFAFADTIGCYGYDNAICNQALHRLTR
jgi:hypothetical protein